MEKLHPELGGNKINWKKENWFSLSKTRRCEKFSESALGGLRQDGPLGECPFVKRPKSWELRSKGIAR